MSFRVAIAVSLLACAASWPGSAQGPALTGLDQIALRPGDAVRITVWRKPEMSGQFTVALDGSLAHPLYRSVTVSGVPLPALEARLRALLERYEESPQFVIEPLLRVTVGGEVARPNLYTLGPETSVSQAVALAGGPTERGHPDRIRLVRGGATTVIDLTTPEATATQLPIRSGDEIFVDRRRSIFREYVTPVITIIGAAAAITSAVLRARD